MSSLLTPIVVLDTNVIRGTKETSTPFVLLSSLIKSDLIRVVIPKLVAEEFRTQWRERQQKKLTTSLKGLSDLKSDSLVVELLPEETSKFVQSLQDMKMEELSHNYLSKFLERNGIEVHPLSFDQAFKAWDAYFAGDFPFKEIKNRGDIPDAHIIEAVKELRDNSVDLYFVAGDKTMFETAKKIEGLESFSNLDDLLINPKMIELRQQLKLDQMWKELKPKLQDEKVKSEVLSFVNEHGGEVLEWNDVHSTSIPEDNHTATIQSYGEITDAEVMEVEDWGAGLLRYRVSFNNEALLSFSVFRADAYDVPDWVSVSYGDPEVDHYFDAEGYAELKVTINVSVKIDLEKLENDIEDELYKIGFETDSVEVELLE